MKNKIAIASVFVAASSFSMGEIVINEFLSFEGFIDMSYTHVDAELEDINESDNSFAIDQVEISWLFDFDPVTAQIDLQFEDVANSSDVSDEDDELTFEEGNTVEQAFVTYHFDNGGAITAGRYASQLGFEAFEPTGLYQYSLAYDIHLPGVDDIFFGTLEDGIGSIEIIPGYAQGVKFTYEGDMTYFGISLQDEAFDYDNDRLGGDDSSGYAVEVAGGYYMDNGLSFFLGGVFEDNDEAEGDTYMINAYVTFETGEWIFAAEVNYGESEAGLFALGSLADDAGLPSMAYEMEEEVLQALVMANFAYSEQGSITGRVSYADHEHDAGIEVDGFKFTLAHGWAFTDNLFLVNEVSYVDGSLEGSAIGPDYDYESLLLATELIFSF